MVRPGVRPDIARCSWRLTAEAFVGPHTVSPVFAFDGRNAAYDSVWESDPSDLEIVWSSADGRFSIHDLAWDRPPNVVLFRHGPEGSEAIGCYLTGMAWLDPAWRGRGLGIEMVVAADSLVDGTPTLNADGMGYAQEGLDLHLRAHAEIRRRARLAGLLVADG